MRDSGPLTQAVKSIEEQTSTLGHAKDAWATPEAVALSILALESSGSGGPRLLRLRRLLTRWQRSRGSVLMDLAMPDTHWPTAWAVLAWRNAPELKVEREKAVRFLLRATGTYWPAHPGGPIGHDTSLRGWPWVGGTPAWVQPTALAVLALDAEGRGGAGRVADAVRLLLDRQLPGGGWNYGNTRIFRNIVKPLPEDTGYALAALRPHATVPQVEASLAYLARTAARVRAPAALAWALLGLTAWDARPDSADDWIVESLSRQARVGAYPLRFLAQLVLSGHAVQGLPFMPRKGG